MTTIFVNGQGQHNVKAAALPSHAVYLNIALHQFHNVLVMTMPSPVPY